MNSTILNEDMRGVYKAIVALVISLLLGFFGAIFASWLMIEAIVSMGGV